MKDLLTIVLLLTVGAFLLWLALGVGYALLIYVSTAFLYS